MNGRRRDDSDDERRKHSRKTCGSIMRPGERETLERWRHLATPSWPQDEANFADDEQRQKWLLLLCLVRCRRRVMMTDEQEEGDSRLLPAASPCGAHRATCCRLRVAAAFDGRH